MMAAYWRVIEVRVIEDRAIRVCFTDGLEGVVRFPPEFFQGVFSHLGDPSRFKEVAVVNELKGSCSNISFKPFCSVIPSI